MTPHDAQLRARFFDAFRSRPRPSAPDILATEEAEGAIGTGRLLAAREAADLSVEEIRDHVQGHLWMLTPPAFRYFLPAFLHASLADHDSLGFFAGELVEALTQPVRNDLVERYDRLAKIPSNLAPPAAMVEWIRERQLQLFDSGVPSAIFHERVEGLTQAEGQAILAFLQALQDARGEDFLFDEPNTAIERHWGRFAAASAGRAADPRRSSD